MAEITSVFQSSIESSYVLTRQAAFWVVEETNPNSKNTKLLVNGSGIFGFSLDSNLVPKPAWKFIKSNAVKGLSSVCDGIFVTSHDQRDYFIVIDLKSTKSTGISKQLLTSIHLCKWLHNVLSLHGHLNKETRFAGVVSKISNRTQAAKIGSVRKPIPEPIIHQGFPIFQLHDVQKISLNDICSKC
ncbi:MULTISPECIES: hypothetical protein [Pantoea]|uniref:hypothetical protein n=1 Tax=Pantoea TaxID=53335 RepID=UPI0008FF0F9E|nr:MULTISPECIES: hypothetical protein [Pantoea]